MKHIINGFYGRLLKHEENLSERLLVAKDLEHFKKHHKANLISGLQFFDDGTLGMYISKTKKKSDNEFDPKTNILLGSMVSGIS